MISDMMDYKDSVVNRIARDEKIDPGTFSLMEPGWWVLHAAAIAGVYLLGTRLSDRY